MKLKPGTEEDYKKYVEVNSNDPYGKGIVDFTEAWAVLMEQRIAAGEKIADIAKPTSRTADTDGITGFMYGCAVRALAHFWEHGEELRQWHNLDTQLQNEGEEANKGKGVLNPAVLVLGKK